MKATHYVRVVTEFKGRMNDGKKVHVEYLVGTIEHRKFTQDGDIIVRGLRESGWFGPTGHSR